jgi:hypothetical protein
VPDIERLWPEQWAVDAWVKAASIESRMRVANAGQREDAKRQASTDAINKLLKTARAATQQRRWLRWRGLMDRWRGTSVGRAYQSLHAAEIFLVDLLSDEEIDALVPRILARDVTELDRDDPRREQIEQLLRATSSSKRACVKSALTYLYDVADQAYVRVRDFRNVLLVSAALIMILMTVFVIAVGNNPETVPFCFSPGQTTATTTGGSSGDASAQVCPSGQPAPSRRDVQLIAGLGLLGGALSGAFSIRKIRGSSLPYDIPIALSLLKVPSGALTAVAAILLLGGDFIPGLSELDSQRQILAYALVFGYAQQLATRFLDQQAQDILSNVPSKDHAGTTGPPTAGYTHIATAGAKPDGKSDTPGPVASTPDLASEQDATTAAAADDAASGVGDGDVPSQPGPPDDAAQVDLVVADEGEEPGPPEDWEQDGHDDRDRRADVVLTGVES